MNKTRSLCFFRLFSADHTAIMPQSNKRKTTSAALTTVPPAQSHTIYSLYNTTVITAMFIKPPLTMSVQNTEPLIKTRGDVDYTLSRH
ncbi:hypothetical protein BaRGS_00014065 [Batillaria attramentaria]|uniref:Uncharacterized protein n=1 Tax=Batillaria attramentaria TaxID=370345 RepID=A0ABD0L6A9_9CAEN